MDISKIQLKQAHLFLNSSIIVQIPASLFILYILIYSEKQIMFLVAPFLVYSLFLFQNYLLYYKKSMYTSKKITKKNIGGKNILSSSQVYLYFSKEDFELLLFSPSGKLLGKIIKGKRKYFNWGLPKEFLLVNYQGIHLASFYYNAGSIEVIQQNTGYIGHFSYPQRKINHGIFELLSGKKIGTVNSESIFLDDKILNENNQPVFQLKKGLMSLDSQEIFGNPNTPVLSVSSVLNEKERLLYMALLVKRYFLT
ncbi:hypothetical protein [Neobacillus sp. D3-1R]|uniref:hypothetical protein n=1 Tax=Neobacillus sp. D3-1R TaxID=3445778 RepID=UPI003FA02187